MIPPKEKANLEKVLRKGKTSDITISFKEGKIAYLSLSRKERNFVLFFFLFLFILIRLL